MDSTYKIIIGLIIILLLILLYKKQENADSVGSAAYSTEAISNIAKVYSDTAGTATFNNINITGKLNVIPKGLVSMWTGTTAPSGWALCDGGTYTAIDGTQLVAPDLRGRFVLGSGQGANLTARTNGQTGGAETHTLTVAEMPTHSHYNLGVTNYGGGDFTGGVRLGDWGTWSANPAFNTGGSQPHNNMPPYYVLAYIVKL